MSDATPHVTNNSAAGQFEIRSEQGQSLLKYAHRGDALDLVHTEVPGPLQGRGYGDLLVDAAFQYARNEKVRIIPTCSFVQHYLTKHPELAALVAAAH